MESSAQEDRRQLLQSLLLPVVFTALWSIGCIALVHHGCSDISAAFPEPVPGTDRAEYCAAVDSGTPWFCLTVLPIALVGGLAWLYRDNVRRIALCVCGVCLVLAVNAILANSLSYSVGLQSGVERELIAR